MHGLICLWSFKQKLFFKFQQDCWNVTCFKEVLRVKERVIFKLVTFINHERASFWSSSFLWISRNNHQLISWSFTLISITTQDWTGVWIPSPNLLMLHQVNCFWVKNLISLQKRKKKKNNVMSEEVARRFSPKKISWKLES